MRTMSVRRALRVLLASGAGLVAGGSGTALATTVSYSGDGTTLIVTGADSANHDIQFRLSADQIHDEILDTLAFTAIPGDCVYVVDPTWVSCPGHNNVQVDLGAGNDAVTFGGSNYDCFAAYALNLGDGANTLNLADTCAPTVEAATVTSGSGPDVLTGGGQAAITFNAGGGDDSVYGGTGNDVVHGGEGNDRLFGRAGNDQVLGEGGADAPNGGAGNDVVDGGSGNDSLELCSQCAGSGNDTGAGADTYVGGPDADKLWLDAHPGGIAVSLDGQANDGLPGEGDNIGSDIEAVEGTSGNDVYTGSANADTFAGGGGNDSIHGGGGPDDLVGGGGDDTLFGDDGNDKVQGHQGADTVTGGAGADQLYGDIASCSVFCSLDSDTLLARDGETDTVDCGGGADSAQVDFSDVVAFCTSVDRSPAPTTAPASPCTSACGPASTAMTSSVTISGTARISKGVRVTVTCSAACSYRVTVVLSATVARRFHLGSRTVVIGTLRGALLARGSKTATLRLSAKARRRLKHARSVKATLRMTATDAAGKISVRNKRITLRH